MAVAGVSMDAGSSASASASPHAVRISRSIEDYPPEKNLWIARGSFDLDNFVQDRSKWILRPPAADLKLVLEALSPGLDGWPLQRLNVLAQKLIACGNDEEPMVPVCQEMRGLLQNVLEALAHEFNLVRYYETLHRTRGNEEERPEVGVPLQIRGLLEKVFQDIAHELELIRSRNTEEAGPGVDAVVSTLDVLGMRGSYRNAFEVLADKLIASGNEEARSLVGVCLRMGGLSENRFWNLYQRFLPSENDQEAMVDLCCQMQRLEIVLEAICEFELGSTLEHPVSSRLDSIFWGNVSLETVLAMQRCGTVRHVVWAFTWVETLLLEYDMVTLPVRTSEVKVTVMEKNIRDRWHKLHFCIPHSWSRSKWSLDFHRRSALFSCGQEREAVVQDFEVPESFKRLAAGHLCLATKDMYHHAYRKPGKLSYGYSWSELRYKYRWWLEHDPTPADPQDIEPELLLMDLKRVDGKGRYDEVSSESLAELQQSDVQLRFDFPVPLSLTLMGKLVDLSTKWLFHGHRSGCEPQELVPGNIGPDVLDRPEVQNDVHQANYAYICVVLRGVQLIEHHGLLEEGLKVLHTCLAKSRSDSSIVVSLMEDEILGFCKRIAMYDQDVDRANRVQAFLVAHGDSLSAADLTNVFYWNLRVILENVVLGGTAALTPFVQQGFQLDSIASSGSGSGAIALPPPVPVPFTLFPFGPVGFQLDARSKARMEAFWKSYKDTCAALSQAAATQSRYEVRHMDTRGSKLKAFAGSWMPYFYMYHVHVAAAVVYGSCPCGPEIVTEREVASEALMCVETARNYREEGFRAGADINWNRIKRAHRACGPGAVFVQFAGLGWHPPEYGDSSDVWPDPRENTVNSCTIIVVQDEGVASLLDFNEILPTNVQELVREIFSACDDRKLERKLESDSCTKALETLYDLLIRPVFDKIARTGNKCYPHRKLIISAVGSFKDVPFSILRNKDSGCYLFEEVKLAFTSSFLMLDHCQSRYEILQGRTLLAGAGAAVALGDPLYLRHQPHDKLPGSRTEVDAICHQFDFCQPQHEVVKLLGGDATVEKLMELVNKASTGVETVGGTAQCSQAFIHIAAHGSGGKESNTGTVSLAATPQSRTGRRRRAAPVPELRGNVTVGRGDVAQSSHKESDEEPQESADSESSNMHATLFGDQVWEASASQLDSAANPDGLEFLPQIVRALRGPDAGNSLKCDDILFSGLEWSAYMVVLSACSTAVGAAVNANVLDIVSFSKAFMTRGVPCTILAQWPVHDSVGVHLMPLFYQALIQGEDACSALQSAMIKMHHSGKYTLCELAPFVVTGLPTVRLPLQMHCLQDRFARWVHVTGNRIV